MKIEMMWIFLFRRYTFKAPAYTLLPLWLLMEVLYGTLFGQAPPAPRTGRTWAASCSAPSWPAGCATPGLERKMNQAIEEQVSWQNDPEIVQASDMVQRRTAR